MLIVGGGLAGTLLQRALPGGYSVLVTAPSPEQLENDSFPLKVSPPVALAHPYPGRSLKLNSFREHVLSTSLPALAELADALPGLVTPFPVLRPLDGPAGVRLKKSYYNSKSSFDAEDVAMLCGAAASELFPSVLTSYDGSSGGGTADDDAVLVAGPGYSVQMDAAIRALKQQQQQQHPNTVVEGKGVRLRQHKKEEKGQEGSASLWWTLEDADGAPLASGERVVIAVGADLATSWFPACGAYVESGQLLKLCENPVNAVVSRGDIHYAPAPEGAVVGSTRWRESSNKGKAEPAVSSERARVDLLARARSLFIAGTHLTAAHENESVWEGRRCTMPDRMPLVGPVADGSSVHVLGAFGGVGLITAPWAAMALSAHLQDPKATESCCCLHPAALPSRITSAGAGQGGACPADPSVSWVSEAIVYANASTAHK